MATKGINTFLGTKSEGVFPTFSPCLISPEQSPSPLPLLCSLGVDTMFKFPILENFWSSDYKSSQAVSANIRKLHSTMPHRWCSPRLQARLPLRLGTGHCSQTTPLPPSDFPTLQFPSTWRSSQISRQPWSSDHLPPSTSLSDIPETDQCVQQGLLHHWFSLIPPS